MITDADGFKFVEDDDKWTEGLVATYKNTVLLYEQIQEIKKALQVSEETLKQLQNKFDEIWRKS